MSGDDNNRDTLRMKYWYGVNNTNMMILFK